MVEYDAELRGINVNVCEQILAKLQRRGSNPSVSPRSAEGFGLCNVLAYGYAVVDDEVVVCRGILSVVPSFERSFDGLLAE